MDPESNRNSPTTDQASAGLDPAAVIGQKLGNGRWIIIDELVSEHGTGALRFARNLKRRLEMSLVRS